MVLQKIWVSQNFSRISRVSQSRVFSRFEVSESRFFRNVQKSQISRSRNLKSEKLSVSQRKTLVSPSRSLDFTIRHPSYCNTFEPLNPCAPNPHYLGQNSWNHLNSNVLHQFFFLAWTNCYVWLQALSRNPCISSAILRIFDQ